MKVNGTMEVVGVLNRWVRSKRKPKRGYV